MTKKERIREAKKAKCTCEHKRGVRYKNGHGHSDQCARYAYENWKRWEAPRHKTRVKRAVPARGMLVPERGLENNRRNRKWLALYYILAAELGGDQTITENLAWKLLNVVEGTS